MFSRLLFPFPPPVTDRSPPLRSEHPGSAGGLLATEPGQADPHGLAGQGERSPRCFFGVEKNEGGRDLERSRERSRESTESEEI